jgi:hypothetical protein
MKTSSQKFAGSFSNAGHGCRSNSTRANLETRDFTANASRTLMVRMFTS